MSPEKSALKNSHRWCYSPPAAVTNPDYSAGRRCESGRPFTHSLTAPAPRLALMLQTSLCPSALQPPDLRFEFVLPPRFSLLALGTQRVQEVLTPRVCLAVFTFNDSTLMENGRKLNQDFIWKNLDVVFSWKIIFKSRHCQ